MTTAQWIAGGDCSICEMRKRCRINCIAQQNKVKEIMTEIYNNTKTTFSIRTALKLKI